MKNGSSLKRGVPGCPHCGSLDLQIDKGFAECDECPWSGREELVWLERQTPRGYLRASAGAVAKRHKTSDPWYLKMRRMADRVRETRQASLLLPWPNSKKVN